MTQPIIVPDKQARAEGQHPIRATGQSFAIHEWSGSGPDYLHVHYSDDEAWHILERTLTFRFSDRTIEAPAGTTVFVPAGVAHTYYEAAVVGPTEIVAFSERIAEFHQRGAEVLGVSVDSVYSHFAWHNTPRREGGISEITFPLISDLEKAISRSYGVLLEKPSVALRGTFLIDQKGIVRSAMVNDLPLGRNIDEILRLPDALQQVEQYGEICPADWHAGDDAMKATPESLKVYAQAHLA